MVFVRFNILTHCDVDAFVTKFGGRSSFPSFAVKPQTSERASANNESYLVILRKEVSVEDAHNNCMFTDRFTKFDNDTIIRKLPTEISH